MIKKIKKSFINRFFRYVLDRLNSTHHCHGDKSRLYIGTSVSTVNTLFNLSSGNIYIGDNTIFGHNCLVLTGVHRFINGKRKTLQNKENYDKVKLNFDKLDPITIKEVSQLTQYSLNFLNKLINNGQFPNHNNKFYKQQILDWMEAKETPILGNDIIIGSGCFIGSGSIINGGVTLGDNIIICSGSVVTKDLPSDTIVGGVPARVIRNQEKRY